MKDAINVPSEVTPCEPSHATVRPTRIEPGKSGSVREHQIKTIPAAEILVTILKVLAPR